VAPQREPYPPPRDQCGAIKQALDTIPESDMRGWFTHFGYAIQ